MPPDAVALADPALAPLLAGLDGARGDCRGLLRALPAVQHWQGAAANAFADSLFSLRSRVMAASDELDAVFAELWRRAWPRQ